MPHTSYMAGALAIIAAQMVALVALLLQRRRRRATQRSLMEGIEQMRKETEFLAREVSGKLITAQEDERKRVARDLHDDLNQRLAMLSVDLELLSQKVTTEDAQNRVDQIGRRVKELASDVHRLSYGLHPAKLDQLGLITAVRTLCRDVSQQSGMQVRFAHNDIPREINSSLALILYRVLQESLHNVVRHSNAMEAQVDLTASNGEIRLVVSDSGCGFDPLHAARGGGLGFTNMRERMRQMNGTLNVKSSQGAGTRVEACAPMVLSSPIVTPGG